jgi:hypothetical protein
VEGSQGVVLFDLSDPLNHALAPGQHVHQLLVQAVDLLVPGGSLKPAFGLAFHGLES